MAHGTRWTWGVAALLIGGCSSMAVQVDRDANIPMPATATYAWGPRGGPELRGESQFQARSPLVQDRIVQATDALMAAKGWRRVEASNAEFLVHFHVGLQPKEAVVRDGIVTTRGTVPVLRCNGRVCWDSWQWGAYGAPYETSHLVEYTEGTVLFDVMRREGASLAWRAVGTDHVDASDNTPEAIRKMMTKLLADLPVAGAR